MTGRSVGGCRGTEMENTDMSGKNAAMLGICRDYSSVENADDWMLL